MIRGGGGAMVLSPAQTFFVLLTRNKPFFPLRQRNKHSPPYNRIFSASFVNKLFIFYILLNKLFLFITFAEQPIFYHFLLNNLFFPQKNHSAPPTYHLVAP